MKKPKPDPIAAVAMWLVEKGVGHALRTNNFGPVALCGKDKWEKAIRINGTPRRICAECRERLELGTARPRLDVARRDETQLGFGDWVPTKRGT